MEDALMNLAMQPLVWASAAALWLSYSNSPLPALVRQANPYFLSKPIMLSGAKPDYIFSI